MKYTVRKTNRKHLVIIPLLFCVALAGCSRNREKEQEYVVEIPEHILWEIEELTARQPTVWTHLVFPTEQDGLLDPNRQGVFQPTASGRLESALFGSVRTAMRSGRLRATFHEGIDIAPTQRDGRGRPRDMVVSVAEGRVAYVNAVAGNSNYGIYIVVIHDDPMGPIYTLYSHLADARVRQGDLVAPGTPLGLMGNTSSSAIPMVRAHLHFEVGVILNRRFNDWFRSAGYSSPHGTYHGWNLLGVDPLTFFAQQRMEPHLLFDEVLDETPVCFEWVLRANRNPDYFAQYPSRWHGEPFRSGAITVQFSENGVPLTGRNATRDEAKKLGSQSAIVTAVEPEVLGRNGRRLIEQQRGRWQLGTEGRKHLAMLLQ